ncbi:MAG: hypothetical protein IJ058_14995 [Lachnospiraceae bacterium]|nr:hypothetical protein [Lachnospiraceae bacterium]MBQ8948087.1 hypothetical protein [Lachnospiraceae bacterium]
MNAMTFSNWCESIVSELMEDEWYRETSSKEKIREQAREFAEDLRFYFNKKFTPADIAGRWWAITL